MNSSIEQSSKAFRLLNPKTLYNPQPFAYSHITEVTQFQRVLHISGQGGENQRGLLSTDFAVQVRQAFQNIELALTHVQATLQDTAVLRILVVDHNPQKHQFLIQEMQKLWKDQPFPACTLIPVPCLALAGMLIEIEATAYCQ
ncbi:RidA family protein [Acinetobacter kyonggiensis]|uniref:Enamine deaminase RidA, house cleaning of reactive enamine intermediates, YjgF/YER057c/UK114 family n=1 Tax=Acinetobacter kyonggiensis TaxID=595670 RepID=A0A1H3JUC2_9GAMM|nr:RidA family protein [Acinetobacter kyonggiensis]SDY43481.1 Enamine deaminase RidA, house cleaning of reactive enamine intermediates, YjgF/YER057c/UK114 family [Acinetobacter kyonggiensis]